MTNKKAAISHENVLATDGGYTYVLRTVPHPNTILLRPILTFYPS